MDISKNNSKKEYTLNLGEIGYGPKGKHSLGDWRAECLFKLKSGSEAFKAWQVSWSPEIKHELPNVGFNLAIKFDLVNLEENTKFRKPYLLDFSNQVFDEDIDLSSYEFMHDTVFVASDFKKNVTFKNSIFKSSVDFREARFSSLVDFSNSKFHNVNFSNTKFICAYLSFDGAQFENKVNFETTTFPGQPTSFNGVSFKHTRFLSGVSFKGNKIGCNADFTGALFIEVANFKSVVFFEISTFQYAIFCSKSQAGFKSKYSNLAANFTSAEFMVDTDFNSCTFSIPAYFLKTKFNGDVEFNNANFNDDVRFFGTEFLGGAFFNNASFTGDAVKRLGQMKRLAEENGQTDQALNFNALELKAKTKLPKANKIFNITLFYEIFSDYGRSFSRPIGWYFLLLWMSFIYAYGYSKPDAVNLLTNAKLCSHEKEPQLLNLKLERAAFEYAMFRAGGVMDLTDTGKQNNSVNCKLFGEPIEPPEMRAWGVFKGIASIALLFLAALGLRNKYRIK